jgi:hypothetical protein
LHYKQDLRNKILAQFELLPNYRFHRFVTGRSALEVAAQHGNGRVALFCAAPGSAGTLAAGDEIKARFPDSLICALEPKEYSTLFNNGRGTHSIEGIGDKMVTLIHNVLTTDYVETIHDEDCLVGLELLERHQELLERTLNLPQGSLECFAGLFGISGICNIIGSIRMARFLKLGPDDNVVTIATDGFDRYPSVLASLEKRLEAKNLPAHFERIFRGSDQRDILDVRSRQEKERLFGYKEEVWTKFRYSRSYLDNMKSKAFWDAEYNKIPAIDEALIKARR